MTDVQDVRSEVMPGGQTVYFCEQLTFDWWKLRRGLPTASSFDRILTPAKGEPSKSQDDYIAELVAERAEWAAPYVAPSGGFVSEEMEEGLRREPMARNWYAMQTDGEVRLVGFVRSACGRYGCSPDALVGTDGVLEMKNPTAKVHVGYRLKGTLPDKYKCQVHGALVVTGRAYCDFVSYCPGFPPLLVRVEPDGFTDKLRAELDRFCDRYAAVREMMAAM